MDKKILRFFTVTYRTEGGSSRSIRVLADGLDDAVSRIRENIEIINNNSTPGEGFGFIDLISVSPGAIVYYS